MACPGTHPRIRPGGLGTVHVQLNVNKRVTSSNELHIYLSAAAIHGSDEGEYLAWVSTKEIISAGTEVKVFVVEPDRTSPFPPAYRTVTESHLISE